MNFSIRQLNADDWAALKSIRLEALAAYPNFFGRSLADNQKLTDNDWQSMLADKNQAIFGLFDESKNMLTGITGVKKKDDTSDSALFFYSYIKPNYQGQKLSRLFYDARIAWAKENNCQNIIISHRESNITSKMANQAFGFKPTGKIEPRTWPDGTIEDEVFYELKL